MFSLAFFARCDPGCRRRLEWRKEGNRFETPSFLVEVDGVDGGPKIVIWALKAAGLCGTAPETPCLWVYSYILFICIFLLL